MYKKYKDIGSRFLIPDKCLDDKLGLIPVQELLETNVGENDEFLFGY